VQRFPNAILRKHYSCGNEGRRLSWMTLYIFLHSMPPPAERGTKNGQRPATKALSPELARGLQ